MLATNLKPLFINQSKIRPEIQDLQSMLIDIRRHIHQYPELGFQEILTSQFIDQKLTEWGINHQTNIAKTGILATINGKNPGKVLAIRCDIDALPIPEENEIEYRSKHNNIMHACGHDGHIAIALTTAYYLSRNNDFSGTVKIIFQPAEEGPGGAKPMIEAGVLKNPDVDAIIGLHLWNNLPLGTVGVRTGALMAAAERFRCLIQGQGGHGAIPHQTVDSILVASHIITALHSIVSRNINPIDSAVVTIGKFHAGEAFNVIADQAEFGGTVRYFNPPLGELIPKRIEEIIAGICQSYGAKYEFQYYRFYPPVINHPEITELVRSVASDVVETPLGLVPECQTMAGEDMSFFLQEVPGCYFFLGSANLNKDLAYPHHHPRFNFDEFALGMGVEIFIRCVEKFCHFSEQ